VEGRAGRGAGVEVLGKTEREAGSRGIRVEEFGLADFVTRGVIVEGDALRWVCRVGLRQI